MRVACKSDVGKKRKNNEDWLYVDEDNGIFILADGIGGHQAGEVASKLAVNEAYTYLQDRITQADSEKEIFKLLTEALFKAHDAVLEKSKTDLGLTNMGTTLVEMIIKDDKAYVCHIGDSRAYLLRDEIRQITKDQTVGDYLVEYNIMKREEVPPQKWHTLTYAVGVSENPVPGLYKIEIKEGDHLLLCSDGLTDMLTNEEIKKVIHKYKDELNKTVDALVKEANRKGGRDNISVVLVKYER